MSIPEPRDDLKALEGYHSPQLDVAVRLNTNESPFPPPPAFVDAWLGRARAPCRSTGIRTGARETLRGSARPRSSASRPTRIFCANGSNEVLQTLLLTYGGPGRLALVFEPTYALHEHIARITATPVVLGERGDDFAVDPERRASRRIEAEQPEIVFLCSPNNPTGTVDDRELLDAVLDAAPGLVVVDEAYGEFAHRSALELRRRRRPARGRAHLLEGLVARRAPARVLRRAAVGRRRAREGRAAVPPRLRHPARGHGRAAVPVRDGGPGRVPRRGARAALRGARRARRGHACSRRARTSCCSGSTGDGPRPTTATRCGRRWSATACSSATSPAGPGSRDACGSRSAPPPRTTRSSPRSTRRWRRDRDHEPQPRTSTGRRRRPKSISRLEVDGTGTARRRHGIPFFDHMLEQLGKHARVRPDRRREGRPRGRPAPHGRGRRHRARHRAEGGARRQGRRPAVRVRRSSRSTKRSCRSRSTSRAGRSSSTRSTRSRSGSARSTRSSWRSSGARSRSAPAITLHLRSLSGRNGHHVIEASFKGVARALRDAVRVEGTGVPVDQGLALSGGDVRALPGHRPARRPLRAAAPGRLRGRDRLRRRSGRASRAATPTRARAGSTSSTSTRRAPVSRRTSAVIAAICAQRRLPGAVGGGVRTVEAAGALLGAGVARVVVGTAAVEHPELVDELATLHPGAVAVGLDVRGREVAVRGWEEGSGLDLVELRAALRGVGGRGADRHPDRARRHARGPRHRVARRSRSTPARCR